MMDERFKLARKNTIRSRDTLNILDRDSRPTPQGKTMLWGARPTNPSYSCREGSHGPFTNVVFQGFPARVCRKCGALQVLHIVNKTITKRELKNDFAGRKLLGEMDASFMRGVLYV